MRYLIHPRGILEARGCLALQLSKRGVKRYLIQLGTDAVVTVAELPETELRHARQCSPIQIGRQLASCVQSYLDKHILDKQTAYTQAISERHAVNSRSQHMVGRPDYHPLIEFPPCLALVSRCDSNLVTCQQCTQKANTCICMDGESDYSPFESAGSLPPVCRRSSTSTFSITEHVSEGMGGRVQTGVLLTQLAARLSYIQSSLDSTTRDYATVSGQRPSEAKLLRYPKCSVTTTRLLR